MTAIEELKKAKKEKKQHLKQLMLKTRANMKSMSSLISFRVSDYGEST